MHMDMGVHMCLDTWPTVCMDMSVTVCMDMSWRNVSNSRLLTKTLHVYTHVHTMPTHMSTPCLHHVYTHAYADMSTEHVYAH